MNDMLKNKKLRLLGLIFGTLAVLCSIWSFLILSQKRSLSAATDEIGLKEHDVEVARKYAKQAVEVADDLQRDKDQISQLEDKMAQGDMFRWVIREFTNLQKRHHVEFAETEQPRSFDLDFFPKLPYKASVFTVTGTGFYQDLGLALADFERNYPFCRVQRLDLDPASGIASEAGDAEKLTVRLEFVALVKPDAAP